jgi:hypothetical protein
MGVVYTILLYSTKENIYCTLINVMDAVLARRSNMLRLFRFRVNMHARMHDDDEFA